MVNTWDVLPIRIWTIQTNGPYFFNSPLEWWKPSQNCFSSLCCETITQGHSYIFYLYFDKTLCLSWRGRDIVFDMLPRWLANVSKLSIFLSNSTYFPNKFKRRRAHLLNLPTCHRFRCGCHGNFLYFANNCIAVPITKYHFT